MDGTESRLRPIPNLTIDDIWRFNLRVDKTGDCWIWEGSCIDGYGCFEIAKGVYLTHRVAWKIFHKEDPGPSRLLHSCNNTRCVNPAHLRRGTHSENMLQGFAEGRKFSKGTSHSRVRLREGDVVKIRKLYAQGMKQCEIYKQFNWVSLSTIGDVVNRRSWSHMWTIFAFGRY